jgi:hypothetical protein
MAVKKKTTAKKKTAAKSQEEDCGQEEDSQEEDRGQEENSQEEDRGQEENSQEEDRQEEKVTSGLGSERPGRPIPGLLLFQSGVPWGRPLVTVYAQQGRKINPDNVTC